MENQKRPIEVEGPSLTASPEEIDSMGAAPLHMISVETKSYDVVRKPPPTALSYYSSSKRGVKRGCKDDSARDNAIDVNSLTQLKIVEKNGTDKKVKDSGKMSLPVHSPPERSFEDVDMKEQNGSSPEFDEKLKRKSGEGSDAGYAGSASSNDCDENDGNNSSSTSDSSDNKYCKVAAKTQQNYDGDGQRLQQNKRTSIGLSSSEIADFSSSDSDSYNDSVSDEYTKALNDLNARNQCRSRSAKAVSSMNTMSSSDTSKRSREIQSRSSVPLKTRKISNSASVDGAGRPSSWDFIEQSIRKRSTAINSQNVQLMEYHTKALNENYQLAIDGLNGNLSDVCSLKAHSEPQPKQDNKVKPVKSESIPFYEVGVDVMAKILSYLSPSETILILSAPLSKSFRENYTVPQDVWKILCLSKPFHAHSNEETTSKSSTIKSDNCGIATSEDDLQVLCSRYKYRLMYASFARCASYLERIKNDLKKGKRSKLKSNTNEQPYTGNSSLRRFFARARGVQRAQANPEANNNQPQVESKSDDHGEVKVEVSNSSIYLSKYNKH